MPTTAYEYIDSTTKFDGTELPPKQKCYSHLSNSIISDKEYEYAQSIWTHFNLNSLGDYHDLYLTTDVLLLCDVFENFRLLSLQTYQLDPCHYYSAPGLFWSAMLKKKQSYT